MRPLITFLLITSSCWAASRKTSNFIVETADQRDADEFALLAEQFRKDIAVTWLGKEMPTWREPCRLMVYIEGSGAGGATTFKFGLTIFQEMEIRGSRDTLKRSVLPHEVTHTVLAHYFREPVPRWADEGIAGLSESSEEQERLRKLNITILNEGRGLQLTGLFQLKEYPRDVMTLYSQGRSVCAYLLTLKSKQTLLSFVRDGLDGGWDRALKAHYNIGSVSALEKEWIEHLKGKSRESTRNNAFAH
jgi:hypothetical protein